MVMLVQAAKAHNSLNVDTEFKIVSLSFIIICISFTYGFLFLGLKERLSRVNALTTRFYTSSSVAQEWLATTWQKLPLRSSIWRTDTRRRSPLSEILFSPISILEVEIIWIASYQGKFAEELVKGENSVLSNSGVETQKRLQGGQLLQWR